MQILCADMKNSVTTESYEICKQRIIKLIGVQEISARKPLFDTLKFWDSIKLRWATCYRVGLHNILKSSLAEAAQASMKAANEKNISLVDVTYVDITDSARLDSKWINRIEGEESRGLGPSQVDERYEARQINRAKRYIKETSDFNDDLTSSAEHTVITAKPVLARPSNNAPPKVKRKRLRSTEAGYFRKLLRKLLLMEGQARVLSLTQGSEKAHLLIQVQNTNYNVKIAKAVRCDCFSQQMAGKKTCCHIIWCLMNIYCLEKNDPRLAHVEFADNVFHDLVLKTPSEIPEHLKTFSSIKARAFCKQLEAHDKFNSEQE